jgi:hypothetical protein
LNHQKHFKRPTLTDLAVRHQRNQARQYISPAMRESGRELLGKLSISLFHKTPRFIALCPKPPKCPPKKDKEMKKIPQKQTNPNSGLLNLKGAPPFFFPYSKAPQLHLSLEKEAGKEKKIP